MSKYLNYMKEAEHLMDAMHNFGLKASKITEAISQNNLSQTIIKHMTPHVQNYMNQSQQPQQMPQTEGLPEQGQSVLEPSSQ